MTENKLKKKQRELKNNSKIKQHSIKSSSISMTMKNKLLTHFSEKYGHMSDEEFKQWLSR